MPSRRWFPINITRNKNYNKCDLIGPRERIELYANDILLASFCAMRRDASQNITMHEALECE